MPVPAAIPRYKYLRVISRTIVTCLCAGTAIILPGFGRVMAFLGSFSAFLICIILPVSAAAGWPGMRAGRDLVSFAETSSASTSA